MRKWIKRLGFFLAVIVVLIAALILFLHTPWGKSLVRDQVRKYLVKQFKTPVEIGSIDYRLPAWIQIKGLLIPDRGKDTLLYGGNIFVKMHMLKLLNSSIDVNTLQLDDIVIKISRESQDPHFNFQFIIDAFSGPPTKVDTATSTSSDPIELKVGQVSLNRIRVKFLDKKEKQYYSLQLGKLYCQPDTLRLERNAFQVNKLITADLNVSMIDSSKSITNASPHNENSPSEPPTAFVALNKFGIRNFQFDYKKPLDHFDLSVRLDTMQLDSNSIDLKQQVFVGKRFLLHNSTFTLNTLIKETKAKNENELIKQTAESTSWNARLELIDFRNNSIVYNNDASKPVDGFDYNHLQIKDFNFSSSQNKLEGDRFLTEIDSCSLIANNKINLKGFRTTANYSDSILLIKDLAIGINQSAFITEGDLAWEFKPGKSVNQKINCRIQPSAISYSDILLIQPGLRKSLPIDLPPSGKLSLEGDLKGPLNDLNIDQLRISSKEFQFEGDGRLNLTNNRENYSLKIDMLKVQKKILSPTLLAELEKENVYLPAYLNATGHVNGTFDNAMADLKLNSDYGDLKIKGDAGHFSNPQNLVYNVRLDMNDFETGKWIGMDSVLGKVTGQIVVKGSGTELSRINSTSEVKINSFVYNGYNYTNVDINAQLSESSFMAKGNINDSNLILNLDINGNISKNYPSIKGLFDIEHVDFKKLRFSKDSITLSTRINIDAPIADPKNLALKIFADSNVLVLNGKRIASDSIWVTANSGAYKSQIEVYSRLLTAAINTNYSLDSLGSEIENILNRINPFTDSLRPIATNNHVTSIQATLNDHELLSSFSPGLKLKDPITIDGRYNSALMDSFMQFDVNAFAFSYNDLQFDSIRIHAGNKDDTIQLTLNGNSIHSSSGTLYKPSIAASWKNNLVTIATKIEDKEGNPSYAINSSVQSERGTTSIKFLRDLTIHSSNWEVPQDNLVMIKGDGFIFQNFSLVNKTHAIHITSKDPQTISPIEISIDSLEIGEILGLASFGDTTLATGNLSAAINIQQPIEKFPKFTGSLGIKKLAIKEVPVGDLQLNSGTVSENLELSGNLRGATDLEFSGNIDPGKGDLAVEAKIQKLDMKLIREFASDFISRASGNISGDLRLTGSTSEPHLDGYIHFDTTMFAIAELNTPYRIDDQKIDIKYPELQFNNFSLSDTLGNKLSIDGSVKMIDAAEYGLDLTANTKNFVLLNSTRRAESVIYGVAIADIDLSIKGTSNQPVIDGKGLLSGKSNIHCILVSSKTDYTNTEKGMIQFVDLDTLASPEQQLAKLKADSAKGTAKSFKGLKYNFNLEVNKDAEFSVLIDPVTGDELVIKGEANLTTGVAENGMMAITGTYQLHSGHYKMNNKFLSGDFMLVDGSTITFNGSPADAQANVTTEYKIDASPAGLLRPAEEEAYNTSKRLPFVIVLTVKGPISAPELAFDIKLKEGSTGIPNALKSDVEEQLYLLRNDQSAMNKQVFSLLVMNQFTVYNTGDFASSDLSPDVALKQGMSQFLAEGMNEIAGNLIKGVDINVNMESYKTNNAQTRTDLGFEMSKNLMNDRLIVTVGKNFTMGEDAAKYQNSSQQYIPDVSTAYKLSRDGRYQVKVYRENEYDAVVEGYFTETGVAFSIQLEYNLFKQIFQSQKKLEKK